MKKTIVGILAIILMFGMSNWGLAQSKQPKQEIVVAFGTDVQTFDLHNYRGTQDTISGALIYETLVAYDRDQKIVPKLATSFKQENLKTWIFNLRKNVKFHDGSLFNAKAAKFSLERAATAGPAAGWAGFIERVDVVDEYTIRVHLKYEYAPVLNNLSCVVIAMMNPNFVQKHEKEITQVACGTGPFKLMSYVPRTKSVYVKNGDYWGTLAKLDKIEFRTIPETGTRVAALKSGEVDLIENPAPHEIPEIKKSKDLYLYTSPKGRTLFVGFNLKSSNVGGKGNKPLREAIAYALNKEELVDGVLEGLGTAANTGFVPQSITGNLYDRELERPFNIEKAKKMLKEAGIQPGREVGFWVPRGRYLLDTETAEVIQGQLEKIGLKVNITVMEYAPMIGALAGLKHDMFLLAWGWMSGEPSQALRQVLGGESTWNFEGYNDEEFNRILKKAEVMLDWKERMNLYNQAYKLAFNEVVIIPILHYRNIYAANKKVKDIYASPREILELNTAYVGSN